MEEAPNAHSKLIDLGASAQEPVVAVVHEPVGQLPFQQVTLFTDHASENGQDAFEASVAKAMALEEESAH